MTSLQDCLTLDAQDPLRALRDQFTLPEGVIYLDGNSLGASPRAAAARVAEVVQQEWAQGLIPLVERCRMDQPAPAPGRPVRPLAGRGRG